MSRWKLHILTSLVTHGQAFCLQLRDDEGFFFLQKAQQEANKITVNVWDAAKSQLEMNKKSWLELKSLLIKVF